MTILQNTSSALKPIESLLPKDDDAPTRTPLEAEVARLHARIAELEDELQQVQRRIHRLLGERNQLSAQLEKRDEQVQNLNRELGGYERRLKREIRLGDAPGLIRVAFERFTAWWQGDPLGARRLRNLARTAVTDAETTAPRERPLICRQEIDGERPVIAVAVFGLDQGKIEALLPAIERQANEASMRPLLLTDDDAFMPLRHRRLMFEYLPPRRARDAFDPALNWDLYFQRRLALIRRKWQPVRVISFGQEAAKIVGLWQESPFEESPLPLTNKG